MARRRRLLTGALSVAGHAAVIAIVLMAQPSAPRLIEAEPVPIIPVMLAPAPKPRETPKPPTPEPPAAAPPTPKPATKPKPPPKRAISRRTPPSAEVEPVPAGEPSESEGEAEVSEAQVAGAERAGSGAGRGRSCDMVERLQAALRRDPRVRAAVAEAGASGKPLYVWNGDWVRHTGQEGAGLAAVREAIMWEVGFSPAACRAERMHGLVLISLNEGAAHGRVVLGAGSWRWSDLLFSHSPTSRVRRE